MTEPAFVADAAPAGMTAGWGAMQYLLILLVVLTMACGAAATVTIALAPAYADNSGKGY